MNEWNIERCPECVFPLQENYAYGTIGGTCFQRISYVELFLQLKKNRYQIGEEIDVTVRARVEGGKGDIDKITAILVQGQTSFKSTHDNPQPLILEGKFGTLKCKDEVWCAGDNLQRQDRHA